MKSARPPDKIVRATMLGKREGALAEQANHGRRPTDDGGREHG